MIRKYYIVFVSLLLLLMATPQLAFAMESVMAEIPFTIERTPGTVVIEAVNDEPLPEKVEIPDVLDGMFQITYSEPRNYHYHVCQIPGTTDGAEYDEKVYNVHVSVLVDEYDKKLYAVVTLGFDETPEKIVFANTLGKVSAGLAEKDRDNNDEHDESPDSESRDPKDDDKSGGSPGDGSNGNSSGGAGASWLPQTSQIWWPVPILAGMGIMLIIIGVML